MSAGGQPRRPVHLRGSPASPVAHPEAMLTCPSPRCRSGVGRVRNDGQERRIGARIMLGAGLPQRRPLAGQRTISRFATIEHGMTLSTYRSSLAQGVRSRRNARRAAIDASRAGNTKRSSRRLRGP